MSGKLYEKDVLTHEEFVKLYKKDTDEAMKYLKMRNFQIARNDGMKNSFLGWALKVAIDAAVSFEERPVFEARLMARVVCPDFDGDDSKYFTDGCVACGNSIELPAEHGYYYICAVGWGTRVQHMRDEEYKRGPRLCRRCNVHPNKPPYDERGICSSCQEAEEREKARNEKLAEHKKELGLE